MKVNKPEPVVSPTPETLKLGTVIRTKLGNFYLLARVVVECHWMGVVIDLADGNSYGGKFPFIPGSTVEASIADIRKVIGIPFTVYADAEVTAGQPTFEVE